MSEVQYHCGYKPLYLSPFQSACLVLLCGNLVHIGFWKGVLMNDQGLCLSTLLLCPFEMQSMHSLKNKNEEVHCMEIPCSVSQILVMSPSVGHKFKPLFLFIVYTAYKKCSQALQGLLTRGLHRGILVLRCI